MKKLGLATALLSSLVMAGCAQTDIYSGFSSIAVVFIQANKQKKHVLLATAPSFLCVM